MAVVGLAIYLAIGLQNAVGVGLGFGCVGKMRNNSNIDVGCLPMR